MVYSEHMSENTNAIKISTETILQASVEVAVYRWKETKQLYPSLITVMNIQYHSRISER
jgi:hypothetical protein